MYREGRGVAQDYAVAAVWYRKAADQGDASAQNNLGFMYHRGRGVPQDYAAAAVWYRKAADQGNASAQNDLGFMYGEGRGVPQDYVQAHMWFDIAAANLAIKQERDTAVRNRDKVAAKMTPAQIAEAQKLAREWKSKPDR
jgi:TPR repeat protein